MTRYILKDHVVMDRCIHEIKNSLGMEVIIDKPKRSQASNRYYWAVLNIISKETGHDTESLHAMIKIRVLGLKYVTIKGETVAIPKPSKDLKQSDFNKLTQSAELMAASIGITLPAPSYYGFE